MPILAPRPKKPVREILTNKRREIEDLFNQYGVVVAYLFGSQTKKRTTPLSDVDIAVLFAKEIPKKEYSDRQVQLITEFMRIFERNDVDVVVLNAAGPFIKHNALKGRLLYFKSERERIQFEVRARRDYFDTQKIRDLQNRALVNRYLK